MYSRFIFSTARAEMDKILSERDSVISKLTRDNALLKTENNTLQLQRDTLQRQLNGAWKLDRLSNPRYADLEAQQRAAPEHGRANHATVMFTASPLAQGTPRPEMPQTPKPQMPKQPSPQKAMEPPAQKSCPRPVMHSAPKKEDGTSLPTSPLAAQSVPLSHAQPASAPPQPAVSGDPPSSETLLTSMLEELDTDVPAALPAAHAAAESVPRTPPAAVLPAEQGVVGCAPTPSAASPAQPAQPAPAPQRKPPPPV